METNNQVRQTVFMMFPHKSPDAEAAVETESMAAQIARSEENILQWMSYLPQDCVTSMIEMGWDITT